MFFLFIIFYPLKSNAEKLKLLVLPLSDGTSSVYSVDLVKPCSFEGVDEIHTTRFQIGKKSNWLIENVNLLQNKINFEIDYQNINSQDISFSLNIATNLKFKYSFDKFTCELKKTLFFNNKAYDLDEIYIEYDSDFFSPVIKKLLVVNKGVSTDLLLYPWALHGIVSTYEFNAGPAVKIHSNIRKNSVDDSKVEVIPAFIFRYGPLFLSKDGLGSLLYHSDEFTLIGMGIIEGEPYESEGLHPRKKGFFLGSIIKYKIFELISYNDFFTNKGLNIKANLAPEFYLSLDFKFKPQIFLQYWDKEYVDYYFGVNSDEANSGISNYEGKSTLNVGINLELMHFVGNWTYVENLGIKSFGDGVSSSPTVNSKNDIQFITSILYKFL